MRLSAVIRYHRFNTDYNLAQDNQVLEIFLHHCSVQYVSIVVSY